MSKFRELKGKELLSLKGKWIMHNSDIDNQSLVTNINIEQDSISTVDDVIPSKILVEEWRYEDSTPVGIKIELSSDGYTLEEFLAKVNDDCSNVEVKSKIGNSWIGAPVSNQQFLNDCIDLINYRVKPTKYIRPKVGFRGSVMCEVSTGRNQEPVKVEVVSVEKGYCVAFPLREVHYSPSYFEYFKLLPFSAENEPPVGTRFRKKQWDSVSHIERDYYERFYEGLDKDTFLSEGDNGEYNYSDVIWLDFEQYEE